MSQKSRAEKKSVSRGKGSPAAQAMPEVPLRERNMAEVPLKELEELRNQARSVSECRDKMLRALAEMENMRKRLEKEKKDFYDFANQELISDLLPVLDNFDRALAAADSTLRGEAAPYRQGIEMIYKQLGEVLRAEGLDEIKALGEHFDPFLHEAVQQEETDAYPDGTVLKVLLKGYLFKGRLLRPAAVKVSHKISPPSEVSEGK